MKILNFGSLNLDYIYRVPHFVRPGETLTCLSRETACGGKGLNQSIALARSGATVYHAGCIGAGCEPLVAMLRDNGVETSDLQPVLGENGHTVIQVNDEGENCIIYYPGSNGKVTPEQARKTIAHYDAGDIIALQNEISSMGAIMQEAHARGMRIALNPSPMAGCEALPLELCDWLFVNENEARALSGAEGDEDVEEAIARRFPATRVIVTRGSKGAAAVGAGKPRVWQDAFPAKAVDTTAAGDTFEGFFLGRVAAGDDEQTALRCAAMAASIAVSRPGAGPSIPTLEEVIEALKARG